MNKIITLDDFKSRFTQIKEMGWIKTHRAGNTGVGKTLEDLLGITENNIQGPDFGKFELKSGRINSKSMLTLITKSPEPAKSNHHLVDKFGYYSDDARDANKKVLHTTLKAGRDTPIYNTGNTLRPEFIKDYTFNHSTQDSLVLISNFGIEEPYWPIETLKEKIEQKLSNEFVYVTVDSRNSGSNEEFKFLNAYLLKGISSENIIQLIKDGIMYVDIRIGQYSDGTYHDHGTGFRIREADQHYLYSTKIKLV